MSHHDALNDPHDENPLSIPLDPLGWLAPAQQSQKSFASSSFDLPPEIIPDAQTSGRTMRFIMSQYEPAYEHLFFRSTQRHMKCFRARCIRQMRLSRITHWSMFIGAQMVQALKQDPRHPNIKRFTLQLDQLHQLCLVSDRDVSLDDLVGRLSGALETAVLVGISSNAKQGYDLMRQIAPVFMQVAFADPTIWPRDPSSNGISLAHALLSPDYELGRFIFFDATTSLAFGIPPLVEYDTSHPIIRTSEANPMEWVHGCPIEFVFSIIKINQWRARPPNEISRVEPPWKEVENAILGWCTRWEYGPDPESEKTIMRLAVQEGWKHALLIYLYMGMCGVTSHDHRVQTAVKQVGKLCRTLRSQLVAGIHFMIPILVAAIAARSEVDRSRFCAVISQSGRNKAWLLRGVEFVSVLDHLWHGAGKDGGPVTWADYLNSRHMAVSIGI